LQKGAENFEIRQVSKGQYFLHEGEPSKFFCGVIKGRISFRKSKIINKETNELVLKHLYRVVLLRKPTLRRQVTRRLITTRVAKKKEDNNENDKENNVFFKYKDEQKNKIEDNVDKNQDNENKEDNQAKIKEIRDNLSLNKSVKFQHRFSLVENHSNIKSYMSLNQDAYAKQHEYKVVKEHFDPKKYIVTEEELFSAGVGYCFGEWALIYNQPRAASVYTLEDCVFFILEEKNFKKSFLKSLINSESRKKKFVIEHLFPFNIFKERQSSLYKNIVPITIERNQIVFNEGDKSDTIFLIYLGTFILEKKYKHKKFNVLSLEKGSIVGLESIFEGENSNYKCTLKLNSYDDFGLLFACNVNKLVPYIINKMKEHFNNNYLLYLKSSEEFYLNNINILKKKFFKKKEDEIDDKKEKENPNLNIKSKGFLSLKNLNKIDKKLFLGDLKKIRKNIKFTTKKIKVESFPFLIKNKDNNSKFKTTHRKIKRSGSYVMKNSHEKIKFKIEGKDTDNYNKRKIKRLKTYFNYSSKSNVIIINNDDNDEDDNKSSNEEEKDKEKNKEKDMEKDNKLNIYLEDNYKMSNRKNDCTRDYSQISQIEDSNENKAIDTYNNKASYNTIKKDKINELLNINHTESVTERIDKVKNAISQCEILKTSKYYKGNLTSKASSVKIFSKQILNDSKNFDTCTNTIRTVYPPLKDLIIKQKTKYRFFEFNQKTNKNRFNSKILLTKNNKKIKFIISPLKFNKNKFKIKKYINYLLSNKNEPFISEDFHHTMSKIMIHSEERRDAKSMSLNNNTIKTRNKNTDDSNYNGIKPTNDSEINFKNNIFAFNSGIYTLPLMTHILNKNKI